MPLVYVEPLPRRATRTDCFQFLRDVGGLDRRRIGRIELRGNRALVEVEQGSAARLVKALMARCSAIAASACGWPTARCSGRRPARRRGTFRPPRQAAQTGKRGRGRKSDRAAAGSFRLPRPNRAARASSTWSSATKIRGSAGDGLIQLGRRKRGPLPWTRLGVGTPVLLSPDGPKPGDGLRGVVLDRRENAIRVALTHSPDDLADHDTLASGPRRTTKRPPSGSGSPWIAPARPGPTGWPQLRDVLLGLRKPGRETGA